jgi:DNA-binding response OmpR family regulator
MRILVVEDDPMVAEGIKEALTCSGYTADQVGSAEVAERVLRTESFDLAIVDLGLPQADGHELIRRMRRAGHRLPVLILTAHDSLEDCVSGLDTGADDFMTKPFRLPELIARVRALIRRHHSVTSSRFSHGDLEMDNASHTARIKGKELDLPGREWSLLESLLMASPSVVSKDRLVQSLGGWDSDLTPNAVEVYVSRLRAKLSVAGIQIRTVRGIGYRLDEPATAH